MNRERSGWLEYQVGHGAERGCLVKIGHLGADKSCAAPSRRLDSILRAAGSLQSFEQGRHAEIALKQASFLRQQDRPCVGKHQDCWCSLRGEIEGDLALGTHCADGEKEKNLRLRRQRGEA